MDLLGGYGSDNSNSSTSSSSSSDEDTAPAPSQSLPAAAASLSKSSRPAESSRRGKRLVSLHAVLPTHILEQLTKSAATGGLDSDEEEVEEEVASRLTKDSRRHATVIGKDEGLSSFLSELKSAPTVTFRASTTTADTRKPAPSQPLGQAFATTQTVVLSQTKNAEIVNVHATKRPDPAPQVKPCCVSEPNAETIMQKPNAAARPAAPRPLSLVSVPRPGMNNRPVVSAPLPATTTEHARQKQLLAQCQPVPEEGMVNARLAKKRSRKEMERALRAGNLQALLGEGVTTYVEVQACSTYAPREETYRVPTLGITKVAPVSMYDPKAGSDVMQAGGAATGKQRGKHQINALLASAASLELQRARAIGTPGGKGKRADAKRKYGW